MRSYRGYVAVFAVLALVLSPALISLARADLERPEPPAPKTGTASVRILGVNDLHGNLEPPDAESGGVAYLDAHMDRYERPGRTLRVHAGDMVGGSPLASSHFHDEPTILAMNEMGFDVGTLGNHEFDEGGGEMRRLLNGGRRPDDGLSAGGRGASDPGFPGARFPYVAANTLRAGSGETVLPPHAVLELNGVRIGFIGVTLPDTPLGLMPEAAAPFRFRDMSEAVNRSVEELRARGVKTMVVLAHSGGEEILRESAEMSDEVDVVFAGHTHETLNEIVGKKLVVEAEEYGRAFSVVDLRVDRRTGQVREAGAEIIHVHHDAGVRPDGALDALVARYERGVARASYRVVAEAAEDGASRAVSASGESALGDLAADARRSEAGADVAFAHTPGLRTDIGAGPVTYGELFAAQPFGGDVMRMEMSGSAVLRVLEQQHRPGEISRLLQVSGLRYRLDTSKPDGRGVTGVTLEGGAPLDPRETYSVAADGYLVSGGDGFSAFEEGKNRRVVGRDVEVLAAYLEGLPRPFVAPDPEQERRIEVIGRAG